MTADPLECIPPRVPCCVCGRPMRWTIAAERPGGWIDFIAFDDRSMRHWRRAHGRPTITKQYRARQIARRRRGRQR